MSTEPTTCAEGRHVPDKTTDEFVGGGFGSVDGQTRVMMVHDVTCASCGVRYRYADYGQPEPDRFGAVVRK